MNFRWMFEEAAKRGLPCRTVRAIGGGAKSDEWMQIFADVTGRRIEAVAKPQDAGALGAALAVPLGLGVYKSYSDVKEAVKLRGSFDPDPSNRALYDSLFDSFKYLYGRLSPAYKRLNTS